MILIKTINLAAIIDENGTPKCPPKYRYNTTKKMCCPIQATSVLNNNNKNCIDKTAPGRKSNCATNKEKCDDPLWSQLMTEQCPKTCNRCKDLGKKTNKHKRTDGQKGPS